MEREHCIYKAREHSSRSGERTLYPVAIIKKYRSDKRTEKIKRGNGRKVCGFLIA